MSLSASADQPTLLSFFTPSLLPPAGAHLLHSHTAPSPVHWYAAQLGAAFLSPAASSAAGAKQEGAKRRFIWLECAGRPHEHIRRLLRRARGSAASTSASSGLAVHDATSAVLSCTAEPTDEGEALAPLQALIELVRGELAASPAAPGAEASTLVVLDDFSVLCWALAPPASSSTNDAAAAVQAAAVQAKLAASGSGKGKGKTREAPLDPWGVALAGWLEELRGVCEGHGAALLTHLHAGHTSVLSRVHAPARAQGAGEGFDADDAGEEDLDDADAFDTELPLPLPPPAEEEVLAQDEEGELIPSSAAAPKAGVEAAYVDALDDSLLRAALRTADVWIEQRALRSGSASDCHGEICIHPLARPSASMRRPIPALPLPGSHDPFRALRREWRASHPSSSPAPSSGGGTHAPLRALATRALRERAEAAVAPGFALHSEARGRDRALLFEVRETRTRCEWRGWRRAGG